MSALMTWISGLTRGTASSTPSASPRTGLSKTEWTNWGAQFMPLTRPLNTRPGGVVGSTSQDWGWLPSTLSWQRGPWALPSPWTPSWLGITTATLSSTISRWILKVMRLQPLSSGLSQVSFKFYHISQIKNVQHL